MTSSTNVAVRGKPKFTVTGKGGKSKTFNYGGGAKSRNLGKLKKGKHRIKVTFKPTAGSVFKGCTRTNHVIKIK